MNQLTNGTQYRETVNGYVVVRGNRTVHLIAKSVNASEKARRIIARNSFDKLYKAGKYAPLMPKTKVIYL